MGKPNSQAEELARDAAARIDEARDAGQQMTFLPDEPQPGESAKAGRGRGKATSMLREWLAARGMRLPEDQLAEMAGLTSREDVFVTAMARTEQALLWAESGGRTVKYVMKEGVMIEKYLDNSATTGQRLEMFKFIYTHQLRAAEALLPYGLAKVQVDTAPQAPVQVNVYGSAPERRSDPRDVTPKSGRIAPPPLPHEVVENQPLSKGDADNSDDETRTEGPER